MEKNEDVLNTYYEMIQNLDNLSPTWSYDEPEVIDAEIFDCPDWQYQIYDERTNNYLSITELVTSDLSDYVRTHISAYVSAISVIIPSDITSGMEDIFLELDAAVAERIAAHAAKNSAYCRRVAMWLSTAALCLEKIEIKFDSTEIEIVTKMIDFLNTVCDEYMKYAIGPWRECTLVEALRGNLHTCLFFLFNYNNVTRNFFPYSPKANHRTT